MPVMQAVDITISGQVHRAYFLSVREARNFARALDGVSLTFRVAGPWPDGASSKEEEEDA